MARRRQASAERLEEARIIKASADRQHDEALVDQVNAVVYGEMLDLAKRMDNVELDLKMINKKLDMLLALMGVAAPAAAPAEREAGGD